VKIHSRTVRTRSTRVAFSPDGKLLVLHPHVSYERASSDKEKSNRNSVGVHLFTGVSQHRLQAEVLWCLPFSSAYLSTTRNAFSMWGCCSTLALSPESLSTSSSVFITALGCGQPWRISFAVILLLQPLFLRDCIRLADRDQGELFMRSCQILNRRR
jgi:hypothetical protein